MPPDPSINSKYYRSYENFLPDKMQIFLLICTKSNSQELIENSQLNNLLHLLNFQQASIMKEELNKQNAI